MVRERPDLIFVIGATSYSAAAHRLTKTIPIVMLVSGYPVEAGLARTLGRPGKNVTGNTVYAGTGVWGKLVEMLREAKPAIKRIAALWGYVPPGHTRQEIDPPQQEIRRAAELLGLRAHVVEVAKPDQIEGAIAALKTWHPDALIITGGQGLSGTRTRVMQFAIEHRMPTVVDFLSAPSDPHPMLSYGASVSELTRQAVSSVVRILRDGVKPGDLPIQQPARFELVVSLKTASAIGLTLPQSILLRADRVIE